MFVRVPELEYRPPPAYLLVLASALAVVGCMGAEDGSTREVVAREMVFGQLFRDPVVTTIEGNAADPIFNPAAVVVAAEGIYVLDPQQAGVLAYRRDGTLLAKAGGHGQGPGQFQRPVAIAAQSQTGNVLVHDARALSISVFTRDLDYLDTFKVPDYFSEVYYRGSSTRHELIGFGWRPDRSVKGRHGSPLQILRLESPGAPVISDAIPNEYLVATWHGAVNGEGRLFTGNTLVPELLVFDQDGSYIARFPLASPSVRPFRPSKPSLQDYETPDFLKDMERLAAEEHTVLARILASRGLVFVMFEQKNRTSSDCAYLLDVYREDGTLLTYGTCAPGRFANELDGKHHFWHFEESDVGRITLSAYELNNTLLESSG